MRECKDCNENVYANYNMVMIHDAIWVLICDEYEDMLCDECMEKRLGREITESDFRLTYGMVAPCNLLWLENKKNNYEKN